jgi:hypothetical protein
MFEFIGFRRELFGKFAKLFRRDAEERQTELIVLEWRIARKRTKLVARERNANSADHFRTAIALWPKLLQRRLQPVQDLLEYVCVDRIIKRFFRYTPMRTRLCALR